MQTFDEVRDRILQDLRARYVADQRDARIKAINTDPTLVVNQAAVDALVVPYDAEAARRATSVPVPGAAAPSKPPAAPAK